MDYNQVAAFVLTEATIEQLNSLVEAIKMRRTQMARKNVFTLRSGDVVSFVSRGRQVKGQVVKVLQKNVHVKEAGTLTTWRVPAHMLSREAV